MSRRTRTIMMSAISMGLLVAAVCLPGFIGAGELEPSAPPGPTMKTLNEIPPTWSQKLQASDRFQIVLDDQAVLDKETGLVWTRSPVLVPWSFQPNFNVEGLCRYSIIGGRMGWRGPTILELTTLIDYTQDNPALPSGHPFTGVQLPDPNCEPQPSHVYYVSTNSIAATSIGGTAYVNVLSLSNLLTPPNYGYIYYYGYNTSFPPNPPIPACDSFYFWCVRGR
jgi:hypothetical protein